MSATTIDGQLEKSLANLSIVIVNWNTRDLLRACLQSLEETALLRGARIVVVDNASSDGSATMVEEEYPHARVVRNETNAGFARAVNLGFAQGDGRYHLMLNSDTVTDAESIATCIARMDAHPEIGVLGCRITHPDGRAQGSCFRYPSLLGHFLAGCWLAQAFPRSSWLNMERYGNADFRQPRRVDCVMGSFFLVRADVLEQVGTLDEGYFMYAEETDFCFRLKKAGWEVEYLPEVSISHVGGGTVKQASVDAWAFEAKRRGDLRFLAKWRGLPVAALSNLMMLIFTLPRCLAWAGLDLLDLVRGRRAGHLGRSRVLLFHVKALLKPSLLYGPWSGPPVS